MPPDCGSSMSTAGTEPLTPDRFRVVGRRREAEDVVTLAVTPDRPEEARWREVARCRPGQFNMLTAFGLGEAAISASRVPRSLGHEPIIEHTVRAVGAVTDALSRLEPGEALGLRGPFGTCWPIEDVGDRDVVVLAGGIGLAPLLGAIEELAVLGGRLHVLVGARMPEQLLFGEELKRARAAGVQVELTVDAAAPSWAGHVGVVTTLLDDVACDLTKAVTLVCGPEVMMRFAVRGLLDRGVAPDDVWLSLERAMQCGIGLCGHCQLGPLLLCRDGPVVRLSGPAGTLLFERER